MSTTTRIRAAKRAHHETEREEFAALLRPLVEPLGTGTAAQACDVSPRSIQLWLRGATPCLAMQRGVLALLAEARAHEKAPAGES